MRPTFLRFSFLSVFLTLGLFSACDSDPAEGGCDSEGKHYAVGASFSDTCHSCMCTKDGIACTTNECIGPQEGPHSTTDGGAVDASGESTPDASPGDAATSGCDWKGKTYPVGQAILPGSTCDGTPNGPGGCFCSTTGIACYAVACQPDASADGVPPR